MVVNIAYFLRFLGRASIGGDDQKVQINVIEIAHLSESPERLARIWKVATR